MAASQKPEAIGFSDKDAYSGGDPAIQSPERGRTSLAAPARHVRAAIGPVKSFGGLVSKAGFSGDLVKELGGGFVFNPPPTVAHLLEISRLDGTLWVNPAFDTSDPNWSSNVVGGKTFDGSNAHPYEWVSVLNPTVEQDDEVGVAGFAVSPDLSGDDLQFTHPFGGDFEFALIPDGAYAGLLAPSNRDPAGAYSENWQAAQALGLPLPGLLGMEIDAALVPTTDRPAHGDRVALFGRWIVDAGHPEFHTEIHPPLLMAYARSLDARGNPVAPSIDATTHMQLWGRPYQAQQKFSSGGDRNLCLQDYITHIVETLGSISAFPPIFAKSFDGVHIVCFTVRPPVPALPTGTGAAGAEVPQRQLQCSYHFTVNGGCGLEVIPSPADPNAVAVVLALNSVGYPTLPEPGSTMKDVSISALIAEAKQHADVAWYENDFLKAKAAQLGNMQFRIFNPPRTSPLDGVNVVPFTPLASLPHQTVSTDPASPFPVRGWLKLAWVDTAVVATTGGASAFDLTGSWSAGGQVGPKISRSGNALTVDMSAYHRPQAVGSMIDANTITVSFPDDATYTGHLQAPGTILWSNGSSWTKS